MRADEVEDEVLDELDEETDEVDDDEELELLEVDGEMSIFIPIASGLVELLLDDDDEEVDGLADETDELEELFDDLGEPKGNPTILAM